MKLYYHMAIWGITLSLESSPVWRMGIGHWALTGDVRSVLKDFGHAHKDTGALEHSPHDEY